MPTITEATHPEFDALLRDDLASRANATVYADWLEERGDLRAQLIRMQLEHGALDLVMGSCLVWPITRPDVRFIRSHWRSWFGDLPMNGMTSVWINGFVQSLELHEACSLVDNIGELLGLPTLWFLEALYVKESHGNATLEGLNLSKSLRVLKWRARWPQSLEPLAGIEVPRLTHLQLELSRPSTGADLIGLMRVRLPSLKTLVISCVPQEEARVLFAVSGASWAAQVKDFELTLSSADTIQEVIDHPQYLRPMGAGQRLRVPPELLVTHRSALKRVAPGVRLRPDFYASRRRQRLVGDPHVATEPCWAPRAVAAPADALFSLCGWCSSDRVTWTHHQLSTGDDLFRVARMNCEYRCEECAHYTSYGAGV